MKFKRGYKVRSVRDPSKQGIVYDYCMGSTYFDQYKEKYCLGRPNSTWDRLYPGWQKEHVYFVRFWDNVPERTLLEVPELTVEEMAKTRLVPALAFVERDLELYE